MTGAEVLDVAAKVAPLAVVVVGGYMGLVIRPLSSTLKELKEELSNYREWRGMVSNELKNNKIAHAEMKQMLRNKGKD